MFDEKVYEGYCNSPDGGKAMWYRLKMEVARRICLGDKDGGREDGGVDVYLETEYDDLFCLCGIRNGHGKKVFFAVGL